MAERRRINWFLMADVIATSALLIWIGFQYSILAAVLVFLWGTWQYVDGFCKFSLTVDE